MKTDTREHIIDYIKLHQQTRVDDLVREFNLSHVAIHKQLKKLLVDGILRKSGKPPLVFYLLKEEKKRIKKTVVAPPIQKVIDDNYLYISPIGELLYGFKGFTNWAIAINQEKRLPLLAAEYAKTRKYINSHTTPYGWIDATEKLRKTFPQIFVDVLLYADFYSLPKFGKTKLGQLMLYAKQSQNMMLAKEASGLVKPLVKKIIAYYDIQAIAFIPPTVPRKLQFMTAFEKNLNLNLLHINLVKTTPGKVIVAQKTLAKLEERIINAKETIFMKEGKVKVENVLLLDDAAGSGATFNETARKLRAVNVGQNKIIAFAVVGSFKGFDVIREV